MKHLAPLWLFLVAVLSACAGKVDYIRPETRPQATPTSKLIDKPRDEVWAAAVPALSKSFYVINNLDKSSGLINVSFSGNPEAYIDCGRIVSFVKNARGERTYDFPAAAAQQSYEIMDLQFGLFFIDRRMTLEGRVNLIFEEVGPKQTRITANTRYVVQRTITSRPASNAYPPNTATETTSFSSSDTGSFPVGPDGRKTECASTGTLERTILSTIW